MKYIVEITVEKTTTLLKTHVIQSVEPLSRTALKNLIHGECKRLETSNFEELARAAMPLVSTCVNAYVRNEAVCEE